MKSKKIPTVGAGHVDGSDRVNEPDIYILDEDIPSRDYCPPLFRDADNFRIPVRFATDMYKLPPEEFRFFLLVLRRAAACHGKECVISASDVMRIAKLNRKEAIATRDSLVKKRLITIRTEENLEGERHWTFYSITGGERICR